MLEISYVGCKFSYLLFAFVGVPVLVFLPYILNLWLHNVPEWTVAFCSILLVLTLVDQLTVLLYQSIMADGHIKVYNVLRSITNLMPILISIIMFSLGDFFTYMDFDKLANLERKYRRNSKSYCCIQELRAICKSFF